MDKSSATKERKKEVYLEWGRPIDAPPMAGIETFTIIPVGNPMMGRRGVDFSLIKIMQERMREDVLKAMEKKPKLKKVMGSRKYRRTTMVPKMVPVTDEHGNVTMQVGVAPQIEMVEECAEILVDEMWRACGQNLTIVLKVLDRFWARMGQMEYKAPDLMSVLLVCAEEVKLEGREAEIMENKPRRAGYPILMFNVLKKAGGIPAGGKEIAWEEAEKGKKIGGKKAGREKESMQIKLVSIREMLRYYFENNPGEYGEAVAKVVGAELGGLGFEELVALIESEIERKGVWEFSVNVWEEVRKKINARKFASGKMETIDAGMMLIEAGGEERWVVCPRWERKSAEEEVKLVAKIIAEHLEK
ncbi:MAG: hypothetical protein ABIH83_04655 [Candidatus Micrarchaeota archaeon]